MALLDRLNAAGHPPARAFSFRAFLDEHPGLDDEVRACRQAGYSWNQIAAQLADTYQIRLSSNTLADIIEKRR